MSYTNWKTTEIASEIYKRTNAYPYSFLKKKNKADLIKILESVKNNQPVQRDDRKILLSKAKLAGITVPKKITIAKLNQLIQSIPKVKYAITINCEPVKFENVRGTLTRLGGPARTANSINDILVYKPGSSFNWWQYVPRGTLPYKDGWNYGLGPDPSTFRGNNTSKAAALLPQRSATYEYKTTDLNLTPNKVATMMRNGSINFSNETLLSDRPIVQVDYPEYIRSFSISLRIIGSIVDILDDLLYQEDFHIHGVDTNSSHGDCVIQVLEETLSTRKPTKLVKSTRGRKPKTIDILSELSMTNRTDGVSSKKLLAFCKKHNIRLGLCDQSYNVLCQNYPAQYDAKKGIFGLVSNQHLYLFRDKCVIDHVFSKKSIDTISFDKTAKKQKCKTCKKEFADQYLLNRHVDEFHSDKDIIIIDDFYVSLNEYIKRYNKIPRISKDLTRFSDSTTIYQLATIDETREITRYSDVCKSFDMPEYSSIAILAEKLFEKSFNNYKSQFNEETYKIFYSDPPTPLVKQLSKWDDTQDLYQYDVRKFYSAIMASIDAPVYSYIDYPVKFNGTIQSPAFYYSESVGWVNDIIAVTLSDITHQLIPSRKLNKDELYDFVDMIFDKDESLAKKIICYLTGMLRKTTTKLVSNPAVVKSETDKDYFHHAKAKQHVIDPDGEYILYQLANKTDRFSSAIPIYNYIIQTGHHIINKIKEQAESQGAVVFQVSTDAIITDREVNLSCQFSLDIKNIGQFKPVEPPETRTPKNKYDVRLGFGRPPSSTEAKFNIIDDIHSHNESLFIGGMPGCGKSTEAKKIKASLKSKKISYYEMSFQNNVCADMSDRSKTFHKSFAMPLESHDKTNLNIIKKFKRYQYVFIDEFQMTPDYILPYLSIIKNHCRCKFILSGDFNQHEAIECPFELDNHAVALLYDYNIHIIKGNKRIKDKVFVQHLENMDFTSAKKHCTYEEKTKYTITYYSRADIRNGSYQQNIKAYEHFTGLKYNVNVIYDDDNNLIATMPDYKLVKNMPVICKKSNESVGLVKGRHYYINKIMKSGKIYIGIDPNFHDIDADEDEIIYFDDKDQYLEYMDLGYAFTSHKSIGLTIKAPYSIVESKLNDKTSKKYWYVALSRCNDPKNIRII